MPLHALTRITLGVPDVANTAAYYEEFGLLPSPPAADGSRGFHTRDGGEQLILAHTPRRRLVDMTIGVDDADDLDRVAANLTALGASHTRTATSLMATDPGTRVDVRLEVTSRIVRAAVPVPAYNSPGLSARGTGRAPGILREDPVRPRKLGHVVVGSTDQPSSELFFTRGIGFKVSDRLPGRAAFLRCSDDHHNLLLQQAPLTFLHHTSWEVDDVDEVGRGATRMLAQDPGRHVWGLGRHHIGSNFFWYLKDPVGNFSEYYSDMDCVIEDQLWHPQDWENARSLYSWGPPPPPSFLKPDDIAELMVAAHVEQ